MARERDSFASPHFRWREFTRDGEDPLPLARRRAYARLCRRYLEPVRARYGPVTITSSLRTRAHNAAVGGAPGSMHLESAPLAVAAVDFRAARGTPRQWADLLIALGCPGVGLYPDHVHADTRLSVKARW